MRIVAKGVCALPGPKSTVEYALPAKRPHVSMPSFGPSVVNVT